MNENHVLNDTPVLAPLPPDRQASAESLDMATLLGELRRRRAAARAGFRDRLPDMIRAAGSQAFAAAAVTYVVLASLTLLPSLACAGLAVAVGGTVALLTFTSAARTWEARWLAVQAHAVLVVAIAAVTAWRLL